MAGVACLRKLADTGARLEFTTSSSRPGYIIRDKNHTAFWFPSYAVDGLIELGYVANNRISEAGIQYFVDNPTKRVSHA